MKLIHLKPLPSCERCDDTGETIVTVYQEGKPPRKSSSSCQECCEHIELDHGICLDCSKDTENLWVERTFTHGND